MNKKFYLTEILISIGFYIFMLIFGFCYFFDYGEFVVLTSVVFIIFFIIFNLLLERFDKSMQSFFRQHNFNILVIILIIMNLGFVFYTIFHISGFNQIMLYSISIAQLNVTLIFYVYLKCLKKEHNLVPQDSTEVKKITLIT